jgi:hypothetical protein
VDGETNGQGSVGYEVWLDGKKAHDSGVLRGGQEAQYFKVSVKGVHRVKIVVTNGWDNENFDHADLCNLRVCAGEKEPAEDYGAPAAATTTTQATAEPAKPLELELAAQGAYAQFLAGLQAMLSQKGWALARTRLEEALKNPQLASRAETLKLDGELLALTEKAWQAIPKGAAALTDGQHFVLLQTDGKKFEVGKGTKTAVKKVEGETIQIEQDIGGGKLSLGIACGKLTFETVFGLARIGLPPGGEGKVALALMKLNGPRGKNPAQAEKDIQELLEEAAKEKAQEAKLARLRAWLESGGKEAAAERALKELETLIEQQKGKEALAAYDAFRKEHGGTACWANLLPNLKAFEARLEPFRVQQGLWASYWSGGDPNRFEKLHFARAETKLVWNWDQGSPDARVPNDQFGIRFGGVLRIEKAGKYGFVMSADDTLKVWIDGQQIGELRTGEAKPELDLTAGDHKIKMEFVEFGGGAYMNFRWKPPGANDYQDIPATVMQYSPTQTEVYQKP